MVVHISHSCFLFGVLFTLGIRSDCSDKALTVCLQQLLHDPGPQIHPVVPAAAASHRGGEVGPAVTVREELGCSERNTGPQGRSLSSALVAATLVFQGVWCGADAMTSETLSVLLRIYLCSPEQALCSACL